MKNYLTKDLDIEKIFKKSVDILKKEIHFVDEIINVFVKNENEKLPDTIKKISKDSRYCYVFSKVYENI